MGLRKYVFPARLMSYYWLRFNCYINVMDFCFGCRSTQNKMMNDSKNENNLTWSEGSFGSWGIKKRAEKKLWMNLIFRKVYVSWYYQEREKHLLMTALTIPFEVTGILIFPCYSSHIRYELNWFQGILLDNHDCLATAVSV